MLANNHFVTPVEENEENHTFITIPIDLIKDVNGQPNLSGLNDFFIGQLPDGTYCLFNNNTVEPNSLTSQDDSILQNSFDQFPHLQYNLIPLSEDIEDANIQKNLPAMGYQIGNKYLPSSEPNEKQPSFELAPQRSLLKNIQSKPSIEKFKCVKCEKLFGRVSELQSHLKWHKSQKKFRCAHCSEGYAIERNLELHMAMVHSDGNLTKCPICNVNFTSQRSASLKSHLMLHHIEELYTCDKCNSEFDHEDDCVKHMLTHSKEEVHPKPTQDSYLSCYHCKLQFQNTKELRRHVSSHVKVKRFFHRQRRFNKPKEILAKEKKFSCNVCSKAFIKNSLLDRHRRIHSGEKPFKCVLCDRSFSQKSTLNVHLLKHTGIRPFACTLCPAKFGQKGNLRVHIQKTHTVQTDEIDQLFRCTHCTCVFKKVSSLNAHVTRVHVDEKLTPDEEIMRKLLELQKLTRNIENSDVDKNQGIIDEVKGRDEIKESGIEPPLNEDVMEEGCVKSMVTVSEVSIDGSLRKYVVKLKKQGENRWYICNYCPKEFKKPSDLIRHIRTHTKEKPYMCHYCKTMFSLKSTLITHMNTHRSDRQFKCVLCDRTFNTLISLNSHIWKHDITNPPKFQCITCGFLCETEEIGSKHRKHMGDTNGEHLIEPFDNILTRINEIGKDKDGKQPPTETSKLFHCQICFDKFHKKSTLLRHLTLHTSERKHFCHVCQRSFVTSQRLLAHLDNHCNKRFECKQCNKKFSNVSGLKEHMKERCTCPYCEKDCKCSLSEHINKEHTTQHTEEVPESSPTAPNIPAYGVSENEGITTTDSVEKESVADNVYVPYVLTPLNDLQVLNLGENIDSDLQKIYVSVDPVQLENHTLNVATPGQENFKPDASSNLLEPVDGLKSTTAGGIVRTTSVISRTPYKNKPNILRNNSKSLPQEYTKCPKENSNPVVEPPNNPFLSQFTVNNFESQGAVIDLNDPKNFLQNANIICVNCSRLHSDFRSFQNHVCNADFNQAGQNVQENGIDQAPNVETQQKPSEGSETVVDSQPTNVENSNKTTIREHNKRKKLSKPIECHLCKRTFVDRIEYKSHLKFHSKARRYECSICKKFIVGRLSYIKHLSEAHSDENGTLLRSCKYCSKEFKKPSDLARHLRVHTGEKPYTCEECKRKFSLKSTLESHMRTHRPKVRPFNCLICNLNFSTKATLKVHQTIHTGAKPYKCLFCDVSFRTSGHRKHHVIGIHLANRRRQTESRKVKIRKMLESVASTILTDIKSEQNSFSGLVEKVEPIEIPNTLQHLPSDSVEATVAAVNTITTSAVPDDSILPPTDLMIRNHMVTIDPSITIGTGSNNFSLGIDSTLTNVSTISIDPNVTAHPSTLNDAIVTVSQNIIDPTANSSSVEAVKSINHSVNNDHLINVDQIGTPHLTVSSADNVLNSIEVNRLSMDTLSLLQQFQQPPGMIVSSDNDDGTIPLILDDVTLLNLELAGENMQIISLSELDSPVVQAEPTIIKQESVIQKPQKARNHECYICNKMYASKDVLRKHIKTLHFKNGFMCSKCDLKFDQKRKLDVHMKKHNSSSGIEHNTHQFLQEACQQPFTSKTTLTTPQYDLLSDNLGDTLFSNFFPVKKT